MVSPVFFGRFPRSSLSLSRPLPTLSPSLIGHLASVDVKQHERKSCEVSLVVDFGRRSGRQRVSQCHLFRGRSSV